MKRRNRSQIEQEVLKLLSKRECLITEIVREVGINSKMASKILSSLDERGLLVKESKFAMRKQLLRMHYRISLSSQQSLRSEDV